MFNTKQGEAMSAEAQDADKQVNPEDEKPEDVSASSEVSDAAEAGQEDWQGKYLALQDQFTRLAADFENYRKRVREEQDNLLKYGAQKTVMELLPVLDNLERATASLNENSDPKVLFKSFSLMQKQLMDGLDGLGIRKLETIGQEFDPQYHEAVNQMASAEFPENTVMYEAQSGYVLHDKVIRPAMVVVSTGNAEEASADGNSGAGEAAGGEARENPFIK